MHEHFTTEKLDIIYSDRSSCSLQEIHPVHVYANLKFCSSKSGFGKQSNGPSIYGMGGIVRSRSMLWPIRTLFSLEMLAAMLNRLIKMLLNYYHIIDE